MSEPPWIAAGLEGVRSTDVPQSGDRLDIVTESLQGWCCKEKRATRKRTQ